MDQPLNHEPSDRSQADNLAAWDEPGYEQIVARFAPMVYARCRRALGAGDADDATQAVFLVLAEKRAQAVASPAIAAWLSTVADYVVLNALRDRKRRRQAEHAMPPRSEAEPSPMYDLREHLDACLAELPAAEREAIRLHHLAGFSLAEVAAHSRQPLSTIHARVKRGLQRLRSGFAKRGLAVGDLALVAGLHAEAADSVPPTVLVHLRDLNPAGRGSGAPSSPSDRARNWSRPRTSLMTRIVLLGAAALLLGSASYHFLTAEDQPADAPPVPAQAPAAAGSGAGAADPGATVSATVDDPGTVVGFTVLRWNDGARLVARLRAMPEAALLRPAAEPILAKMAGVHAAMIEIDTRFGLPVTLTPEQAALQSASLREQAARAPSAELKAALEARAEQITSLPATAPVTSYSPSQAWVTGDADQQGLIETIDQKLNEYHLRPSLGDQVQLTPGHLTVSPRPGSAAALLPAAVFASQDPSADIEMNCFPASFPDKTVRPTSTMAVKLDASGIGLTTHSAWGTASSDQVAASLAMPHVDRQWLTTIPGDALVGGALAVDSTQLRQTALWPAIRGFLAEQLAQPGRDPATLARGTAVLDGLEQVHGRVLFWAEPGFPVPTVTVQADMPQAAATAMLTGIGATPATDGSWSLLYGIVEVTMGWKDGHLLATTRPEGLDAAVASGGFCDHADIRDALADLPKEGQSVCILLRQAAFAAQLRPILALGAKANDLTHFDEYQKALDRDASYGSFCLGMQPDGVHAQAHGLLALVGAAAITAVTIHPEALLKAIN